MQAETQLRRLFDAIWLDRPGWVGRGLWLLRLIYCALRELRHGDLTLRAMSLVYTTLLAMVPLLALSFSVFKALGLHNEIEPLLLNLLAPIGEEAPRVARTLLGFVDNVKIGVLGSIGVAMLFYTVLAMIQKVEASFNNIWNIPRTRPLGQRISQYLVVLLLGPLAISLTLGITASLSSTSVVGSLLSLPGLNEGALALGRLMPFLLVCGVFSFFFYYIPNTPVAVRPALVGGFVSGALWQSAAWAFAKFVAGSGNYNAVYSGFAILIVLLIWLYIAWLILLIGCQMAFFVQYPEHLSREREPERLGALPSELLMLDAMLEIGRRFYRGGRALGAEELCRTLGVRPEHLNPLLVDAVNHGLLAEGADGSLLLARAPETLSLVDILATHGVSEHGESEADRQARDPLVREIGTELVCARTQALGSRTLADLLRD